MALVKPPPSVKRLPPKTGTAVALAKTGTAVVLAKTAPVTNRPVAASAPPPASAEAGFGKARELTAEQQRKYDERKNTPFRFSVDVGKSADVLLLDVHPFFIYEHSWKNESGKFDRCLCIKDTAEICPRCMDLGKEGSYILMLSCIDRRPYTDKDGKVHNVQRKLFPVKGTMIQKYERLYKKNGNSFRGVVVTVNRDGAKASATGDDVTQKEDAQGRPVVMPEAMLQQRFGELAQVVDYSKAFPRVTAADLRQRYGGRALPGADDGGAGSYGLGGVDLDSIPF